MKLPSLSFKLQTSSTNDNIRDNGHFSLIGAAEAFNK